MQSRNFHDRLVHELGRRIGAGTHPPGSTLPVEKDLAAEHGVSRVVVREAVKALAAKGMVVVRPRTGTRIRPRESWNLLDPQVIGWRAAPPGPGCRRDGAFIADLMELRRIVEPPAVRLAAARARPDDLLAIRTAFTGMQAAVGGHGDYVTADLAFHGAIVAAAHNQFLRQLSPALSEILTTSFRLSSRDQSRGAASLSLHEDVLRGIETREGDAAVAAIERLIVLAGAYLEDELAPDMLAPEM